MCTCRLYRYRQYDSVRSYCEKIFLFFFSVCLTEIIPLWTEVHCYYSPPSLLFEEGVQGFVCQKKKKFCLNEFVCSEEYLNVFMIKVAFALKICYIFLVLSKLPCFGASIESLHAPESHRELRFYFRKKTNVMRGWNYKNFRHLINIPIV